MSSKTVEIPINEAAERHVLGAILNRWNDFGDVCSYSETLFSDLRYRLIFDVMLGYWRDQKTPTIKDIWRTIQGRQEDKYFTGFQDLRDLQQGAIGLTVASSLAECVEAYQRRCLLEVADSIFDRLHRDRPKDLIDAVAGDLTKIHSHIADKTYSLTEVLGGVEGKAPLIDVVERERADLLEHGKLPMAGPSTGIREIDELTRGLPPGSLVGVGAATGVGKSDFLARMIYSLINDEIPILIFTMEMSATEYAARLQAIAGSVSPYSYLSRRMDDVQWNQVKANDGRLRQFGHNCIINGNSSCLPEEIIMKVKREMVKLPIQVVIVDHLGLMEHPDPKASDYVRMGHSSRMLKKLAMELNICVVEAAQFNRTEAGKRPTMNSFRDSGKVGEDMDNAILIHRPNKDGVSQSKSPSGGAQYPYNDTESNEPADDYIELIVAKNRTGGGRLKTVEFDFNKRTGEWIPRRPLGSLVKDAAQWGRFTPDD